MEQLVFFSNHIRVLSIHEHIYLGANVSSIELSEENHYAIQVLSISQQNKTKLKCVRSRRDSL